MSVCREWDGEGEPEGWQRVYDGTHRRRPGGDKTKEYIDP